MKSKIIEKRKKALENLQKKLDQEGIKTDITKNINNPIPGLQYTALMAAVARDMSDLAQNLIENNADVNASDKYGKTALMLAVDTANEEIMKLLINNGADINSKAQYEDNRTYKYRQGYTALAIALHNKAIVEFLLDNGADIDSTDVIRARETGENDMAEFLEQILKKKHQEKYY